MNTIVISSPHLKQFLVFETYKRPIDFLDELKSQKYDQSQEHIVNLLDCGSLSTDIVSDKTFSHNEAQIRNKVILNLENEGYKFIGDDRGIQETFENANNPDTTEPVTKINSKTTEVSGMSAATRAFFILFQILFWLCIAASFVIGIRFGIITGISIAIAAVVVFGLIFILGDLLKNIIEINKKL